MLAVGESGGDSEDGRRVQAGRVRLYRVGEVVVSEGSGQVEGGDGGALGLTELATISGAYEVLW